MQNLPSEILLNIAGRLEKQGLLALALTKKPFTIIAQDVLYRCPSIMYTSQRDPTDRMTALLHPLVNQPGLAQLVHSLELYGQLRKGSLAHDINPDPRPRIHVGLAFDDMLENAIIHRILNHVPKLERLVLELQIEDISDVKEIFLPECPLLHQFLRLQREIAGIPGLKNLRELYVEPAYVEVLRRHLLDSWEKQGIEGWRRRLAASIMSWVRLAEVLLRREHLVI